MQCTDTLIVIEYSTQMENVSNAATRSESDLPVSHCKSSASKSKSTKYPSPSLGLKSYNFSSMPMFLSVVVVVVDFFFPYNKNWTALPKLNRRQILFT